MTVQEIQDDLSFLQAWEDRFEYIMDLGKDLSPFPENLRVEETRVKGCMSQVWLVPEWKGESPVLSLLVDSDSALVKGLAAVLICLYEGFAPGDDLPRPAAEIFAELGLSEHLSPGRKNGLASMEGKIISFIRQS